MQCSDLEIDLSGPEAQRAFGARLAEVLRPPCVLFLEGELGTGKTTLTRGIIEGLGYSGQVRSPTYTLIEPYELDGCELYHCDLYRLADPDELEYLGMRDLLHERAVWAIEWPERGADLLPRPDLRIRLLHRPHGRRLILSALSSSGESICLALRSITNVSS
ncbi:tRNA (adenosine(37)-N6)-threonylcarbamoyltransferase complex ATPase subunit type 1 TsaE [Caldichromatium japonicum]|uniref:tRNA threonylcarbamoyladenosine biosynthesis protein TsaE n=1 Tax=Caldichromatium japonicum TaxID=2699430 RepID=A0A6G7VEI7_9GAMM|nr:tRNA (adenosine(37)-N6)-threonylcarbamoyltransferase complex ATPase subunit type 1 TsaE [Caldichromatium japonicum]QIK38207.1 tRNA (adenosine(37)-N6)-threonylcarbamoyltransferase complex ATPase subunit type 1 TsaE [Caldichromatium japonicum]